MFYQHERTECIRAECEKSVVVVHLRGRLFGVQEAGEEECCVEVVAFFGRKCRLELLSRVFD